MEIFYFVDIMIVIIELEIGIPMVAIGLSMCNFTHSIEYHVIPLTFIDYWPISFHGEPALAKSQALQSPLMQT